MTKKAAKAADKMAFIIKHGQGLTAQQADILNAIEGEGLSLGAAMTDLNMTPSQFNREYMGAAIALYKGLLNAMLNQKVTGKK